MQIEWYHTVIINYTVYKHTIFVVTKLIYVCVIYLFLYCVCSVDENIVHLRLNHISLCVWWFPFSIDPFWCYLSLLDSVSIYIFNENKVLLLYLLLYITQQNNCAKSIHSSNYPHLWKRQGLFQTSNKILYVCILYV